MKALIIDNERDIRTSLVDLLKAFCPEILGIEEATSIATGLEKIKSYEPDVVFLDVELDEGTGFDLLRELREYNFQLIFVTAHNKYAVEAFRFAAIDFLVKPFDPELLIASVARVRKNLMKEDVNRQIRFLLEQSTPTPKKEKIVLKSADSIHFIDINDIIYLEADANYTKFTIENSKEILVSGNLKEYELMLENQGFMRTHHSFLVNLSKVRSFDKKNESIILSNQQSVPVSTRKKEQIFTQLGL